MMDRKNRSKVMILLLIVMMLSNSAGVDATRFGNTNVPILDTEDCSHDHQDSPTGGPISADVATSLALHLESDNSKLMHTNGIVEPASLLTIYETEPNNTPETANEIRYNRYYLDTHNIFGTITVVPNDLDFFRLEVITPGTLYLLGCWVGNLAQQGFETELGIGFATGDGIVHFTASPVLVEGQLYTGFAISNIPVGTYYIRVGLRNQNAVQFVNQAYGYSMEFIPDDCYLTPPTFFHSDFWVYYTGSTTDISWNTTNCVLSASHGVKYRYELSDGTITAWSYQNKHSWTWTEAGMYWLKAQARCEYKGVESEWSEPITIQVLDPCELTTSTLIDGPLEVELLETYTYIASPSTCSNGHDVYYGFIWGDGTTIISTPSTSQNKSWTQVGTYEMRVRVRCLSSANKTSDPYLVKVTGPPMNIYITPNFPEGGTYTGDGVYQKTEVVTFTAFPNEDHHFHAWMRETDPHAGLLIDYNPLSQTLGYDEFYMGLLFRKKIWPSRIAGSNRFETSLQISQTGWSDNSTDVVFLARSHEFADALAGVPLAHAMNAPILLTPHQTVYSSTLNEIERLGARRVVLLGGTAAISDQARIILENTGFTVERIAGSNRFATAAAIADRLAVEIGPLTDGVIVTGMDFPDALSAAAYAAVHGQPILLVNRYSLPTSTEDALDRLSIKNLLLVGGYSAISSNVEGLLDVPGTVIRASGNSRYDTAVAVSNHFNPQKNHYYLASGTDFPDAITGAILAAREGTGVLLVSGTGNAPSRNLQDFLVINKTETITLLGGISAIGTSLEAWFSN